MSAIIPSIVNLQKNYPRVTTPDWYGKNYDLSSSSEQRRDDSRDVRQEGRQLRQETAIRAYWDNFKNNCRLEDRIIEVDKWREELEIVRDRLVEERNLLREEKSVTEVVLDSLDAPFSAARDCLSLRDSRRGSDLVTDVAEKELDTEVAVLDTLKDMLTSRCHEAWEQDGRLLSSLQQLLVDIGDKRTTLIIDREQYSATESSSNISYRTEPLRIPKGSIPPPSWDEFSRMNKQRAEEEIAASGRLREALFLARERTRNDLTAQTEATDYALRRREYESRRAVTELEWQRSNLLNELDKQSCEQRLLEKQLEALIGPLQLAESRLEARTARPGAELCRDGAQDGLMEEVLQLRRARQELEDKRDQSRAAINFLSDQLARVEEHLLTRQQALATDRRCLDIRGKRRATQDPPPSSETERNVALQAVRMAN